MLITVMKSKISYAKITQTELYYVGSITIDEDVMDASNIIENERVQVVNLNNGARLETYVIKGKRGSKVIGLNGPAARLGAVSDDLFIISYAQIDPKTESLDPIVVDMRTT
ncbi:aspartate 1-decarboxylase [bacterium]|jgi:aspartate 1-decarboxylase|nr:aspartate 1-decarboxylase [bacterium]